MEPKVSIALTAYNQESYIAETLDSILSQEVDFEYEIVVGEDRSPDRTREILLDYARRHPAKFRLLLHEKNLGYVRNFDLTLRHCRGSYIAIFDGDDIMLPGKLQRQADFLDANPGIVMSGHDVMAVTRDNTNPVRLITPPVRNPVYTIADIAYYGSFFANSSKMFRRKCLPPDSIDPAIKIVADWYITLEIVGEGEIGYLWETLARYRIHSDSIMRKLKGKDDFEDKKITIEKINRKYDNKYARFFRNQWAYAYMIYGMDELQQGHTRSARGKLIRSIREKYNYSAAQYFYLLLTFLPLPFRQFAMHIKNAYVRN